MRNRIVPLSLAAALALVSVPVLANNKGGQSGSHGHATTPVKSTPVKTTGQKSTHASSPKSNTSKNPHTTTTNTGTTSAKGNSKKNNTSTTSNTTTSSTSTTSSTTSNTSTTNTWTPTNAVSQKLVTKSNLLTRARNLLPPNTDLNLATSGFKNFGQFVAAMNVSRNLNIDFGQLKAAMTGTNLAGVSTATSTAPATTSSLGQAIQKLKPTADANTEAARAEAQATVDIQQ